MKEGHAPTSAGCVEQYFRISLDGGCGLHSGGVVVQRLVMMWWRRQLLAYGVIYAMHELGGLNTMSMEATLLKRHASTANVAMR